MSYIVPYIAGQGLNNQLWEYRAAAIVARAFNRTLCLEPVLRFYLTTTGREFIPFDELFDVDAIATYARVTVGGGRCARACGGRIHRMIALIDKTAQISKVPYRIADWRPGSLIKFGGSTGFKEVPMPTFHLQRRHVSAFQNLSAVAQDLGSIVSGARCVGLQGTGRLLDVEEEKALWVEALRTSPMLVQVARQVRRELFSGEPYLAIHWRFEETKCAGYGLGIGSGRSVGEFRRRRPPTVTKGHGNLCFFAGTIPGIVTTQIWLRLVSKEQVAATVKRVAANHGLKHVFLATDGKDAELIGWVKHATGAVTLSDLPRGWMSFVDNDVTSRLEQQICQDANVFMGTQGSSWTLSVMQDRLKREGKVNLPRSNSVSLLSSNSSIFFDVEVCDCEWTSEDTRTTVGP